MYHYVFILVLQTTEVFVSLFKKTSCKISALYIFA